MARWHDRVGAPYSPGLWVARMVRRGWKVNRVMAQFHDNYSSTVYNREVPAIAGWLKRSPGVTLGVTEAFNQGDSRRRAALLRSVGGVMYSGFPSLGHGRGVEPPVTKWGSFLLQPLAARGPHGVNAVVRREQVGIASDAGIFRADAEFGYWPSNNG